MMVMREENRRVQVEMSNPPFPILDISKMQEVLIIDKEQTETLTLPKPPRNGPTCSFGAFQRLRDILLEKFTMIPRSLLAFSSQIPSFTFIITHDRPEGAAKATPREARALRAQNDGTREGYEAEEEARKEAIEWDTFTEANRKGEGNTMNRG